jgi:hypothetical protein
MDESKAPKDQLRDALEDLAQQMRSVSGVVSEKLEAAAEALQKTYESEEFDLALTHVVSAIETILQIPKATRAQYFSLDSREKKILYLTAILAMGLSLATARRGLLGARALGISKIVSKVLKPRSLIS